MVLSETTHGVENRRIVPFLIEDSTVTATAKRDSEAAGSVDRRFTVSRQTRSTASNSTASRDRGAGVPRIDRQSMAASQKPRGRGGREEEESHAVTGSLMSDPAEASQRNVADAALVARGAIKSGYLWKMGSNVPKWKRRFFVLKPITMLFYYMSEYDTEPRGCIDLDLFDAIRKVEDTPKNSGGSFGNSRVSSSSSISSSSSSGRSSTLAADVTSSSNTASRTSESTTFELYRSGCQGGSGFMLEARGNEDWEQWVEAIANGRHDKMRAELEVVRGANKLLLEEISGLEQQVATFRGYADQRHVTVLALRDERQRCREVASEVSDLANVASTISGLIAQHRERERRDSSARTAEGVGASPAQADACVITNAGCAVTATSTDPDDVAATAAATISPTTATERSVTAGTGAASSPSLPATATGADEEERSREGELAEERRALETIRSALLEARAELERRGRALEEEREARRAVEGRVEDAENAVLDAEESASKAEAAVGRARGRVSVLERNVEFLRAQQRGLRAELCQASEKVQAIRAQRALLKKEIRHLWSKKRSAGASTSSGTRTWASMGDLAGSHIEGIGRGRGDSIHRSSLMPGCDRPAVAKEIDDGAGERVSSIPRVVSAMSSLSGDTSVSATVSNAGGTTDLGDIAASEASDEGGDIETVTNNQFQASVRRSILKRVGGPRVPSLPPSRHLRILQATRSFQSCNGAGREAENAPGSVPSAVSGNISSSAITGGTKGATGAAGLGMAGLLLGLKKGVVDKAAQEMGKKLALWPGGIPSVSSFGSLSNAASNAAANSPTQAVLEELSGFRSAAKANVAAAPDWTASADLGAVSPGGMEDAGGSAALEGMTDDVRMLAAGGIATRSPSPVPTADGGLSRVSSMSRTALIQLSDLELAEPCGVKRTAAGADVAARKSSLPPTPDDEYELLFTSRVIGLQFKELAGSGGVVVQGRNGYVGPSPTGVPGERLYPEIGDALESYNGVSARGKSAEVVAGEIAQCGRPLRLGFRSSRVDVVRSEVSEPEKYLSSDSAWKATDGSLKGGGGGSCRDAVAFSAPAHTWAVSS